jgi:polar amino acid transport system substrate-binding protein
MNALHCCESGAHRAMAMVLATALSSCTTTPGVQSAARSELAPTGRLRVGLFNKNPVYVTRDDGGNELRGVAADLGRELAKELGVEFEAIRYPNIDAMLSGATASEWDVAFLGIDPARAVDVDYSAAYMEVDYTYLVPGDSPIQNIGDADRPGYRIAVAQGGMGDSFLTSSLKRAELVRVPEVTTATLELLSSGDVQAVVWNRLALLELAESVPGSRVVEGRFYGAPLGLAVAKGRPVGTAYVKDFVEEAKTSGMVQQAIQRADLRGVKVAPPASK